MLPPHSIPTRRELVKEAARNPTTSELKAAAVEQSTHAWSTDPLSNKPLARPVVSDALGRLYNKDALLEHLLPAADPDDAAAAQRKADAEAHVLRGAVRSLKDVVEVRFEVDADAKGEDGAEVWVCPVARERLGPGVRAVYLVPCGHAFAGSVIKEAGAERTCLQVSWDVAVRGAVGTWLMGVHSATRRTRRTMLSRLCRRLRRISRVCSCAPRR